jgi:hypothetical protein
MMTDERGNQVKVLRTEAKVKAGAQRRKSQRRIQVRVAPAEAALNRLSRRLQAALAEGGIPLGHALKNLKQVRQHRFQRLYGKK